MITINYMSFTQILLQATIEKDKFKLNVGASLQTEKEPMIFELVKLQQKYLFNVHVL